MYLFWCHHGVTKKNDLQMQLSKNVPQVTQGLETHDSPPVGKSGTLRNLEILGFPTNAAAAYWRLHRHRKTVRPFFGVFFGIEIREIILYKLHHVAKRNLIIILSLDIQLTTKYDQLCVCAWGPFGNISVYCHDSLPGLKQGDFLCDSLPFRVFGCSCGIAIIWI